MSKKPNPLKKDQKMTSSPGVSRKTEREIAGFKEDPQMQAVLLRTEIRGIELAIHKKAGNDPAIWRSLCVQLAAFEKNIRKGKPIPRGTVHLEIGSRRTTGPNNPDVFFSDVVTDDQMEKLLRYVDRNLITKN